MVRVALINPGRDRRFAIQEPLVLGFLASYLEKNNIEVKIFDEPVGENVAALIDSFKPDIVGLTAVTPLIQEAYRLADICRQKKILTVIGGVHASIFPEEALKHTDIVIKGEGEVALVKIAKGEIKSGIIDGSVISNLDEVPIPSRHLMKMDYYLYAKDHNPGSYLYFVPPRTKVAAVLTSRGCPYDCIFCHNSWQGLPYRFNSVDRVLEEIGSLISDYGVQAIFFIEDNIFVNKKRIQAISRGILQRGYKIVWGGNARVDNLDRETLQLAKEAGCRQITFGFESGSQRILDVLRKRTTVAKAREAIRLCKEVGLKVNGTFMIGNPTETPADIKMTQDFIRDNPIDAPGLCIATPFPGTEMWNMCLKKGLVPLQPSWSDFTYDRVPFPATDSLSEEEIKRFYQETLNVITANSSKSLKEFLVYSALNPRYLLKILMKLLSNPSRMLAMLKRWLIWRKP
ncbi:B12-binding domain-containing radical SAM protein [Candidatus Margulisiibacteriota bacterium]